MRDKKNNNTLQLNEDERSRLAFLNSTLVRGESVPNGLSRIEESNDSILSQDISYDKTDEDLDELSVSYLRSGKKWKRPSAPPMPGALGMGEEFPPPTKKDRTSREMKEPGRRRSKSAEIRAKVKVDEEGNLEAEAEIMSGKKKKKIRHSSGPSPIVNGHTPGYSPSLSTGTLRRAPGSASSLTRPHNFQSKTLFGRVETCGVCDKKMRFAKTAYKCRDCKATVHTTCRDELPLPCNPISTPGSPGSSHVPLTNIKLAELAPYQPPYVPAIVIHCINEVEARGLTEKGIYRLSGSDKEVKELKEKFLRGRGTPNLSIISDIHAICGCLKDFLRSLSEPLLTYRLWERFVKAAEDGSDGEAGLYQAISELPQANRDTLAYLIIHLQKVCESPQTGMSASSLAKMFGPSVVGYSVPEPQPMEMIAQTRQQHLVMERFLKIRNDYWSTFIHITMDGTTNNPPPITPPCPRSARRKPSKYFGPLE